MAAKTDGWERGRGHEVDMDVNVDIWHGHGYGHWHWHGHGHRHGHGHSPTLIKCSVITCFLCNYLLSLIISNDFVKFKIAVNTIL